MRYQANILDEKNKPSTEPAIESLENVSVDFLVVSTVDGLRFKTYARDVRFAAMGLRIVADLVAGAFAFLNDLTD